MHIYIHLLPLEPPSIALGCYSVRQGFLCYIAASLQAVSFKLVCSVAQSCLTLRDPYVLQLARLLCPWNFTGKNTGVGCHPLLQGILLTQGSRPCLPHAPPALQTDSLSLRHRGSHGSVYMSILPSQFVPLLPLLYFKSL